MDGGIGAASFSAPPPDPQALSNRNKAAAAPALQQHLKWTVTATFSLQASQVGIPIG
jgi:hypothetical protein